MDQSSISVAEREEEKGKEKKSTLNSTHTQIHATAGTLCYEQKFSYCHHLTIL